MKRISDCIEETGLKTNFSRKENGKKISFVSDMPFECEVVNIDKCVFDDKKLRRCDYLFLASRKRTMDGQAEFKKAYYIELKGDDIRSACEQLFNSIDRTKSEILGFDIKAKVVGTKGFQPKMINNEFYRNVKRLIKRKIEFHKVHKGNNFTHIEQL